MIALRLEQHAVPPEQAFGAEPIRPGLHLAHEIHGHPEGCIGPCCSVPQELATDQGSHDMSEAHHNAHADTVHGPGCGCPQHTATKEGHGLMGQAFANKPESHAEHGHQHGPNCGCHHTKATEDGLRDISEAVRRQKHELPVTRAANASELAREANAKAAELLGRARQEDAAIIAEELKTQVKSIVAKPRVGLKAGSEKAAAPIASKSAPKPTSVVIQTPKLKPKTKAQPKAATEITPLPAVAAESLPRTKPVLLVPKTVSTQEPLPKILGQEQLVATVLVAGQPSPQNESAFLQAEAIPLVESPTPDNITLPYLETPVETPALAISTSEQSSLLSRIETVFVAATEANLALTLPAFEAAPAVRHALAEVIALAPEPKRLAIRAVLAELETLALPNNTVETTSLILEKMQQLSLLLGTNLAELMYLFEFDAATSSLRPRTIEVLGGFRRAFAKSPQSHRQVLLPYLGSTILTLFSYVSSQIRQPRNVDRQIVTAYTAT